MNLIDTHTHLYLKEFKNDRKEVIERAVKAGVSKFFLPNIDSHSIPDIFRLVREYPGNCFPMMGLHPCSVNEHYQQELQVVEYWLEKKNTEPDDRDKFYAVGEIGIDLYWDKTFYIQQHDAFKKQIDLAKKYKLPIVIHTRNAFEETFDAVKKKNEDSLRGIFHCFSGTIEQANQVIALGGFKLGIGGVVTFKNSGLDNVVKEIALEHLVLETDSPYLAPVPHRGDRNESSYLSHVVQKIAELKSLSTDDVARITSANAELIFGN